MHYITLIWLHYITLQVYSDFSWLSQITISMGRLVACNDLTPLPPHHHLPRHMQFTCNTEVSCSRLCYRTAKIQCIGASFPWRLVFMAYSVRMSTVYNDFDSTTPFPKLWILWSCFDVYRGRVWFCFLYEPHDKKNCALCTFRTSTTNSYNLKLFLSMSKPQNGFSSKRDV